MQRLRVSTTDPSVTLEAVVFGNGPPRAVVAPPHPLYGGHLSNPVVQALLAGLTRRGMSALAFNWRGIGASDGRPSGDLASAREDYRAALAHVAGAAATGTGIVAAGYSFGGATAVAVALDDARVTEIVVVAPPVAMLPTGLGRREYLPPIHVIAAELDSFAAPGALRRALADVGAARITVIAGADHFFSAGGTDEIVRAMAGVE